MGLRAHRGLKNPRIILTLFILSSLLLITAGCPGSQQDGANHSERLKADAAGGAKTQKTAEMTDIHDIKPLENPQFDYKKIVYPVSIGLVILLIGFILYYFIKNRKSKTIPEPLIADLPPDELALQQLKALENNENHEGRLFYFRLSAILREYIKGRYGINATEMTTEELVPKIDEQELNRRLKTELRTLLHSADPIKFAGDFADRDRMKRDLEFVREFVLQTRDVISG